MARSFGELRASLSDWAMEPVRDSISRDALNDAIEKLWMKAMQCNLSNFMGGPVTFSVASGTERTQLVSIVDPTVAPVPSQQAGGNQAQHTVQLGYTLVTESESETLMSPVAQLVVNANQVSVVPAPAVAPGAVGYNVYAGSSIALMAKQNPRPIPFDQSFYEPVTGYVSLGQDSAGNPPPTENTTADDIFYIKSLEVALTAGGYKRWEQTSLDGTLFRIASRTFASTSEYQPYYYDLVNGRTLEYRPALGTSFNPRYFYVHKPRRYLVDTATLPFTTFPHEEFLKAHSLAYIFLAFKELPQHQSWLKLAQGALADVMELLTQQNWGKDQKIIPYMR